MSPLLETVRALNQEHGVGDVREIREYASGRHVMVRQVFTGQFRSFIQHRVFRVRKGVVHALGHQRKIRA